MPWPKGQPRKGHVNKDGTPHKPKSFRIKKSHTSLKDTGTSGGGIHSMGLVRNASGKRRAQSRIASTMSDDGQKDARIGTSSATMREVHGATNRPIIETCPNCNFAYADGGYCPSCGWSAPIKAGRVY